jgi:hypothetical protein
MSEHFRHTFGHSNQAYQWCDAERCVVINCVTGEAERFGNVNAIMTLEEAKEKVFNHRMTNCVIVRLDCIAAFNIADQG